MIIAEPKLTLNPIIGISVSEYRGTDRFDDPVFYVLSHCSDVDVINSIVLYVYMRCQCDRIKTFVDHSLRSLL